MCSCNGNFAGCGHVMLGARTGYQGFHADVECGDPTNKLPLCHTPLAHNFHVV